jgi:hypothetical protein
MAHGTDFCQQGFHLPPVLVFQQNISNHKPPALRASIREGQHIGWHVYQVNPWGYEFCLSGIAEGTFYGARIHSGTVLAAAKTARLEHARDNPDAVLIGLRVPVFRLIDCHVSTLLYRHHHGSP